MTWINTLLNLFFNFKAPANPRRTEGSKIEVLFPSCEVMTPDYAAAIELELYEQHTIVKATLTGDTEITAVIDENITEGAELLLILTADGADCAVTMGTGISGDNFTVPTSGTVKCLCKYDGTNMVSVVSSNDAVQDGAITAAKLASDAVTTAKILNANVTAAKLASDAVETAKIKDKNVTLAKLEDGTEGDILVFTAQGWAKLPKGTDGQVLKMVSGAPAWAADAIE